MTYDRVKCVCLTGPVTFQNDLESIKNEAGNLKKAGIDIVIALTHCGYPRDLEIATQVTEVDIVVGGHTNTFLYHGKYQAFLGSVMLSKASCFLSGKPPQDNAEGDYPTVVNRSDGTIGLVVQDFWFGKYLGSFQVQFDADGKVIGYSGNPILLNGSVTEGKVPFVLPQSSHWEN